MGVEILSPEQLRRERAARAFARRPGLKEALTAAVVAIAAEWFDRRFCGRAASPPAAPRPLPILEIVDEEA